MRRLSLACLPLLAACAGDPATPRWEERDAVKLNGIYYVLAADEAITPGDEAWRARLGAGHATVARHVPCGGVRVRRDGWGIQDPCGLRAGDSNVLAAGTPLYADAEFGLQRVLAVHGDRLLSFNGAFPPD